MIVAPAGAAVSENGHIASSTSNSARSARATPPPAPWDWLYGLTGAGMWCFVRARFEVEILGAVPRVDTGQLWVSTHRAETDVPLLCGILYFRGGMWRPGATRTHFAGRDDMFEPGIVTARIPLPGPVGRLAWPLTPGRWLPRVRVHPIRRPTGLKLGQLLAGLPPETPLAGLLGPRLTGILAVRARRLGQGEPRDVGAVRRPAFARELWLDVSAADLATPLGAERWRAHIARAAGDVRRLVRLVAEGSPLLLFPEGQVSPDGAIGPVGEILDVVVRRGRPRAVVPVGIAYDPLSSRRTSVAVGVGAPVAPEADRTAGDLLAALRHSTPVTCGQVVCGLLADAAAGGDVTIEVAGLLRDVTGAVERALAEGRPVAEGLASPGARATRLERTLAALATRGCLRRSSPERVPVERERLLADPAVRRLVNEHRAVWQAGVAADGHVAAAPGTPGSS